MEASSLPVVATRATGAPSGVSWLLVVATERRLLSRARRVLADSGCYAMTGIRSYLAMLETGEITPGAVALLERRDADAAIGALERFGHSRRALGLIAVHDQPHESEVRREIERGVDAVVLAEGLEQTLPSALEAVRAGQLCVPRRVRPALEEPVLTTREKQILNLVVHGLGNAEIGGRLFIAESTVKSHLGSAFKKLGVGTRNEAVRLILDPERRVGLGVDVSLDGNAHNGGRVPRRFGDGGG